MNALTKGPREFPGLSRHAFQHPLDSQALAALKNVPALPTVLKFFSEKWDERFYHAQSMSHRLRVNARQYPSLHKKYVRMAQILDVPKLPGLFIENSPVVNATAYGMENYTIVLHSALLDALEDEEMLAVLGHELGHVKCEHMLYKDLAYKLANGGVGLLTEFPIVGMAVSKGLGIALYEWNRKAEFSCDRAALLATQSVDAVASALAKFAGYSKRYAHEISLDEAAQQADDYESLGQDSAMMSLVMTLVKLEELQSLTHPHPVVRVREIQRYAASPEYARTLAGEYRRDQPVLTNGTWEGVAISSSRYRPCTNCAYPCDEGFAYCPNCQTNVRGNSLRCTSCSQPVEQQWVHCMRCGAHLLGSPS